MADSRTLPELLRAAPADATAVVVPETGLRLSYGSLRGQIEAFCAVLAGLGVGRGDRVAMALPNGPEAVMCFLAASAVGTAAPLNPAYREEEFRFYLQDTGARVLLVPKEGAEAARRAAGESIPVVGVSIDAGGALSLSPEPNRRGVISAAADDVALVLHTSGSTGTPKRVPLKHANLTISVRNVIDTYRLTARDVSLCVMPLFHVHGLVASTLATLATGGTVVVPPRFNPLSFWRLVQEHGVTWYSAVPTMHELLLARATGRPAGAEQLRFIRSCSAALPADTMRRMEEVFGTPVLEAYGMTEASHQMASNPLPPAARKPGSVGPGTGVRISILTDDNRHAAAGQVGEVVIRGPNVIDGYENNPQANASSFHEGWFRTGDQGMLDAEDYLVLTGRLKELINRGGEKIAPREIDEALLAHPAVAEAVCFGARHPTWGEQVAAAVVLKGQATEKELIDHCRQRLADFKCPTRIHLLDSIPRTATGKIQRRVVASSLAEGA